MGRYLRVPPHLSFSTLAHGRPDYGNDHKPLDFPSRPDACVKTMLRQARLGAEIRKPNVSAEQEAIHDGD